jgi:hypothetical protein
LALIKYIFYCRICLRNAIYRRNIVSRRSAYPSHGDGPSRHRRKRRYDSNNYDWTNIVPQFGIVTLSQPLAGEASRRGVSAVTNVSLGNSPYFYRQDR